MPLAKKLGLKDGMKVIISSPPKPYDELFTDFPTNIKMFKTAKMESIDFIHIFCTRLENLEFAVSTLKPALKKNGLMWISWPKGNSKIETDLKREPLRSCVLDLGLVDVKVCAVDEDWSGLKFVYRLTDR